MWGVCDTAILLATAEKEHNYLLKVLFRATLLKLHVSLTNNVQNVSSWHLKTTHGLSL